ncbi:RICIN domain-containing protein [Streptomyces sp. UNOC14_S4]|uniref:RICIN domain-containing protein n=1 Tax=Streptomyces sp. UNOC14_S4 TaxID=2872340 RepID=UPI001E32C640|nr:RICIN domain-containing protein [Streptomyces sp. UNOC14_S4]MCC3771505.1 RICIN domain-containing protein [Streptomyces sp. UNOC14_S4]
MRRRARATAVFLAVSAAFGLAAPAAVAAPRSAPDTAFRMHNSAFGGCLTAEGSGYRDPGGTRRPWLVSLQPCDTAAPAAQQWVYSQATHQYWSQAQPYRCIDGKGSRLVTELCDADSATQRFRPGPAGPGGQRTIAAEADGRVWGQDSHRAHGGARIAFGDGVRQVRGAAASADQWWVLSGS